VNNIYVIIARYENFESKYVGEDYNSGGYPYFSPYPYVFSKESAKRFIKFWVTEANKICLRDVVILDLIEVNVKNVGITLIDTVRIKPFKEII